MPLQEHVSVEKDLQLNSKAFHLAADFNHVFSPALEKAKRNTMLHTMNNQRDPLFMMW